MLAASFLSRMQVRPLGQMADAARRFGRGELGVRVEESPKNTSEINDLARAFNTMVDSLESSERRRQEFVANVSHELKTPMTTIGGYIDGMLDGTIPPEKQQHYMQIVSGEVRRLSRLVRNMLDISRLQAMGVEESRMTRFDLGELMSDVIITFEQKINGKGLNVDVELPDRPVWVKAERDGITQVVYNLLDNAIKFCPQGGKLGLFLALEGGKAKVTVQNSGPTMTRTSCPSCSTASIRPINPALPTAKAGASGCILPRPLSAPTAATSGPRARMALPILSLRCRRFGKRQTVFGVYP